MAANELPNEEKSADEYLEVIEGLLGMCMDREKQITELVGRIEDLEAEITSESMSTVNSGPYSEVDEKTSKKIGPNVLISDDSRIMLRQLSRLLTANGYNVVTSARDKDEIIRSVKAIKPDVVTLEISISDEEGVDIIRTIKSVSRKTRIILISGELDKETILKAVQSGVHDYIAKPVQPLRLLQVVGALVA